MGVYKIKSEDLPLDFKVDNKNALYEIYRVKADDELSDQVLNRIIELYNILYLSKYSMHNPMFTKKFVQRMIKSKLLTVILLRERGNPNQIDGVVGYWERNNTITAPLLGYDMKKPRENRIFIIMTTLMSLEGRRLNKLNHRSGGVSSFKRRRNAITVPEFMAVYYQHLPLYRRLPFHFMTYLSKLILKIIDLKREEL